MLMAIRDTEDERSIANKLAREEHVRVLLSISTSVTALRLTFYLQRSDEPDISKEAKESQANPTLPVSRHRIIRIRVVLNSLGQEARKRAIERCED